MVTDPTQSTEDAQGVDTRTRGTVHLERPVVERGDGSFEQLTFRGRGESHFGAIRGEGQRMHLANDYFYETGDRLLVPEGADGKWTMRHVGIESGVGGQNAFWEIGRDNAGNPILMSSRHNARPPEGFDGPTAGQRGASGFSGGEDYGIRVGEGRELAIAGATGTNTTDPHFDLGLSRLMPDGTQQRIDSEWAFAQVEAGADPNSEKFWQDGIAHTQESAQQLAARPDARTDGRAGTYFAGAMGSQGAWRVDHVRGNMPGEHVAEAGEDIPAEFYTALQGDGQSYNEYTSAELLALIGTSTQQQLADRDIWTGHSNSSGQTNAVRNLQTTELKDYYPQAGTEGLSARAQQIAGDGLVGEITHHGAQLSQDAEGVFADAHILETLQDNNWGDGDLLKLDASLNRYSELHEGADVVPVDGVFREADASRVTQFIEEWRAENNGETFDLGNAAVKNLLSSGVEIEALADLTGMDASAIEDAQSIAIEDAQMSSDLQQILLDGGARADYAEYAMDRAEEANLNPVLIGNQFAQESQFNPNATSPAGAKGIAQFMPDTGSRYGLSGSEFYDPHASIDAGVQHMSDMIEKYGDHGLALVAYNGGEGALQGHDNINSWMADMHSQRAANPGGRPGLWRNETYGYVEKIMGDYIPGQPYPPQLDVPVQTAPEAEAEELLLSSAEGAPSATSGFKAVAGTDSTVEVMGETLQTAFATAGDVPEPTPAPANTSEQNQAFAQASSDAPAAPATAEETVDTPAPTAKPVEQAPVYA